MPKTDEIDYRDEKQQKRFQSYLKIHLKNQQREESIPEQIKALQKRGRFKWWHLVINVIAILFFGYSFYFGITQLSQTFFIIIMVVFGINVVLIFYQKKQINDLIAYLSWKQKQ